MGIKHHEEDQMEASPSGTPGLKRSLSVWAAVGLSVALMAPSMAANINPQGSALHAGRAVPLTFLIAAVGVLLVAYSFVRLCQYFHHAGSVYAFVGATLGPRTGVVAGWGLLGTYTFYAVVTSAAAGIFGTAFLQEVGIWHNPPTWAPFVLLAVALLLALFLAIMPARRGATVLLSVEGTTVALILVVTAVVLVRLLAGNAPGGHTFTLSVFSVSPGTPINEVFLGVVFGFLSFAGFEAAAHAAASHTGSLAGSGSVTLGAGTLTAGGNNSSTTYSGVASGAGEFAADHPARGSAKHRPQRSAGKGQRGSGKLLDNR
jgi:amino acid transporter